MTTTHLPEGTSLRLLVAGCACEPHLLESPQALQDGLEPLLDGACWAGGSWAHHRPDAPNAGFVLVRVGHHCHLVVCTWPAQRTALCTIAFAETDGPRVEDAPEQPLPMAMRELLAPQHCSCSALPIWR